MKKQKAITLLALAFGLSAWPVNAQQQGGQGNPPPPPPIPPILAALDANHDGVIDATEIANASAALKTLDTNGDGKLTMDELMPPPPNGGQGGNGGLGGNGAGGNQQGGQQANGQRAPRKSLSKNNQQNGGQQQNGQQPGGMHGPPPPLNMIAHTLINALDTNHDGVIDASEIAAASDSLKTLDTDGDGKITLYEMFVPPPPQNGGNQNGGQVGQNGNGGNQGAGQNGQGAMPQNAGPGNRPPPPGGRR